MKKIFITGCSGYLGSKVVNILHSKGYIIYGLDVNEPPNWHLYKYFQKASVTDKAMMDSVISRMLPDVAVHLAFVVNSLHNKKIEEEVALEGTKNFLSACSENKISKIVFMSSVAAYGAHKENDYPLTENSRIKGNELYSYSRLKGVTDKMAQDYMKSHPERKFVLLRPCLFVGPNTKNSFFEILKFPIIPRFIGTDIEFQFIHEDDMAECVVAAIEKEVSGIYNVAGEGKIRISEIAKLLGRHTVGLPSFVLYPFTALLWFLRLIGSPPGQLDFIRYPWIMDNSKMKRALFTPHYSSKDAILEFLNSFGWRNH